ncbi:MAG: DUF4340 domain-containing protein [Verrucomicrobiae bacterium]|nr:DUF4340 domain-containing protein [Verrucomicrobiae bacterium]
MKPKTTLILLAVAAVMFAFIWFKERQLPSTEDRSSRAKRVFDLKSDDLTKLQIQLNTSNYVGRIVIEKEKDKWFLREPLAYRASGSEINSICSELEFLERKDIITPKEMKEKSTKLVDYGFDKPAAELTFSRKDKATTVKIGKASPVGNTVYIQIAGRDDILLVDKSLLTKLDRKIEEFRDKSVAEFSTFQATRLEISQAKKVIELVKAPKPGVAASVTDKIWRIAQPLNARADQGKVDGLLDKLRDLKAESFVTDKPADMKTYDLDQPQLELTVYTSEQEGAIIVQFGGALKDDATKVYCKRKGSDTILAVRSDIVKDFTVQVNDLRDKKLADFNTDDAKQVAINFANQTIRLNKDGEDWKLVEPEAVKAESSEVSTLLGTITGIEVKEFVADVVADLSKYGLDKPYYTLTVKKEAPPVPTASPAASASGTNAPAATTTNVVAAASTNTPAATTTNVIKAVSPPPKAEQVTIAELLFGKEDKEKKLVYCKRGDEAYVYAIESSDFEKLPKTALALRNRTLVSTEKSKVTSLSVLKDAKRITVEKKDDKWKLAPDVQGVLDTNVVDDVLWTLTGLSAEKFVSAAAADKAQYGLDKPSWQFNFEVNEGGTNKAFSLSLGKETSGKGRYGLLGGQPPIFELSSGTVSSLTKDLLKRPETNVPPAKVTSPPATNAPPAKAAAPPAKAK